MKRIFKRKAIRDIEILPHYNPCSAKFPSLNLEFTALKIKHVILLRQDSRKKPYLGPGVLATISSFVASIKEGIFLSRVSVEVTKDEDRMILVESVDHRFCCLDCGV